MCQYYFFLNFMLRGEIDWIFKQHILPRGISSLNKTVNEGVSFGDVVHHKIPPEPSTWFDTGKKLN